MSAVLLLVGICLDIICLSVFAGVMKIFWGWFVVSTFDVVQLTWAQCLGILMLKMLFAPMNLDNKEDRTFTTQMYDVCFKQGLRIIVYTPLLLAFGWLVKAMLLG